MVVNTRVRALVVLLVGLMSWQVGAPPSTIAADPSTRPAPSQDAVDGPPVVAEPTPGAAKSPPAPLAFPPLRAPEGVPPAAAELVDRRTESSQTFDAGNGKLTTHFFTTPVFYQERGAGPWRPIDVGFRQSAIPGEAAISDRAPSSVAIARNARGNAFLTLGSKNHSIRFSLPADLRKLAGRSDATFEGPVADFPAFLPGVDLRVLARPHGAKSFFIWREAPTDPSIRFVVDAPGLTLRRQANGSIALVDRAGAEMARIPKPFAVDSSPDAFAGGGHFTDQVRLAVGADGRTVTVSVDPAWLATAVFPVYVDPTTGWVYNAGSDSYGDAHIASNYPTLNFDDYQRPDSPFYHELWNGTDPSGTSGTSYDYLRWNLSAINGTTVDSASLALWPYHQYYNAPTQINTYVRRVTAAWTENGVTWNSRPSYTTTGTVTEGCVEGSWCTWAVTGLVQGWLTTPTTNLGFQVDTIGQGGTYWKRFISSEQGGTNRPRLTVTYHTPTATGTTPTGWKNTRTLGWTYGDTAGHAQSHYEVEVDTASNFAAPLTWDPAAVASVTTSASIPTSVTLANGTTYYWRVRVKDGTSWSPWSAVRTFQWDAAAPTGTISLNAGAAYSQSSTVTATLSMADANSGPGQMRLSTNGGTSWSTPEAFNTSKQWTLASGDGSRTLSVQYYDVATNVSATYADSITVDTVNPSGTISINSGAASANTPAVTLNVTSSDATSTVSATHASNNGTTWTAVSGTAVLWTLTAGDGLKTVYYRVTDGSGRTTTVSDTIQLTTDTTPPGAPSQPDLIAGSDSGQSSTDDVTNDSTPTFTGGAEAGSTVTIFDGTTAVGSGPATGGNYSVTTSALSNGVHSITAEATDAANNTGPSSTSLSVTIDTIAPAAPSTLDLDAASDSGSSAADNITNDATPTILGGAESGTTVTLLDEAASVGTATATGGAWTITASALSDGAHSLTALASDLAGNQSIPSLALSVTIDTVAPAAPAALDLQAGSDSGASSTDNITNDMTPTLTGSAEAGTTVSLLDGASPVGSGPATGGTWTITSSVLASASHSFAARATDVAGNQGTASSTLAVTIDAIAPSADFGTPNEGVTDPTSGTSYVVAWAESGTGSAIVTRSLERSSGSVVTAGSCAGVAFTTDGAPVTTGSPVSSAGLTIDRCYRWVQTLTDTAGNASPSSSGFVIVGSTAPAADFVTPNENTTIRQYTTGFSIDWIEGGPVPTSRSLQRQRAAIVTPNSCAGLTFVDDGAPVTTVAPVITTGLLGGYCYRWTQTLTAGSANSTATSGVLIVDVTPPTLTITGPVADVIQTGTSVTVSWTEFDAHSGVLNRSVQRQVGDPLEPGHCEGVHWVPDGTTTFTASPRSDSGLVSGRCYRWVMTLFDRAGNGVIAEPGLVMVDSTAPSVAWVAPAVAAEHGATAIDLAWTVSDETAGVQAVELWRQEAAPSGGVCPATGWTDVGPETSPVSSISFTGLAPATCYRWFLGANDAAGNAGEATSGTILTSDALISSSPPGDVVFDVEPVDVALASGVSASSVELVVDGSVAGSDSSSPFQVAWSTEAVANGDRAVALRVHLAGGGSVDTAPVQIEVDNDLPAVERVLADDGKNRLTEDEFALYGVYSFGSVWSLPERYQSATQSSQPVDPTQFVANLGSLSPETQDEINTFLADPYRGDLYLPPPNAIGQQVDPDWDGIGDDGCSAYFPRGIPAVHCKHVSKNGNFVFTYAQPIAGGRPDTLDPIDEINDDLDQVADKIPDYVNKAGSELERARTEYTTAAPNGMGYEAIPSPMAIRILPSPPGCKADIECSIPVPFRDIYMPASGPDRPEYAARHELFHQVEYEYREFGDPLGNFGFWFEGAAEWATKVLSDGPALDVDEYFAGLEDLLNESRKSLTRNGPFDAYGSFIFGVYLEHVLGEDSIRQTWERDGSFWEVIRDIAASDQNPKTIEQVLVGWAEAAYLFDFDHETDFHEWRDVLTNEHLDGEQELAGDAVNPNPRPRDVVPLAPGVMVDGEIDIEVGGFQAIEFQPVNGEVGALEITVFQEEQTALSTQILRMERYPDGFTTPNGPVPTICERVVLDFTPDPEPPPSAPPGPPPTLDWNRASGVRSETVVVSAQCPYVTLLIAHQNPFGAVRHVEWEATFIEDDVVLDNFSRDYVASAATDSFGTSSSGRPWVGAGSSSPVSRGVDGSYGYVDGNMPLAHIQMPPSVHGQEFTASVKFRFNGPAGDGSNSSSWLYVGVSDVVDDSYFFGHRSPFVEIDFNNGAEEGDGQMGIWGGDALEDPNWMGDWIFIPTEQDVVTFTPGEWYVMRYHFVPGEKQESKLWQAGTPEPDYQIVDTLDYRWSEPAGADGSGPIQAKYLWLDLRGFNGRAEVDYVIVRPEVPGST